MGNSETAESSQSLSKEAVETAVEAQQSGEEKGQWQEEDGKRNGSDSEEDDARGSSVDPSMIHTAITEKDNPFMQLQDDERDLENRDAKQVSRSRIKPLLNPNEVYQDDMDDILPSKTAEAKERRDSGESSSLNGKFELPKDLNPGRESSGSNSKVQILEANKLSEGQGRTYIAYTIRYKDALVRRRYSDFESLRNILVKLFPMSLIPPIPEKQSIKTYGKAIAASKPSYLLPSDGTRSVDLSLSVINGSVNNSDERLIRHRIRMLTGFLNKLLLDSEVTKTTIISDFLDPNNTNWSDFITSSATFSSLPRSVLQCNPLDPTATTRIHASLPIPHLTSQSLLHKDNSSRGLEVKDSFQAIEKDYKRYENILSNGIYKYSRRITRNMYDMKHYMKELSEAYAQFAATQSRGAELAEEFSHISNAFDESASELESTVGKFYYNIDEPLSECVRMAGSARDLIKFRKLKRMQLEMIRKYLASKRNQLEKLEEHEKEMKKVDSDVDREMSKSNKINLEHPQPKTYSGKLLNKFNKLASMVKESVNYQDPDLNTSIPTLKAEIQQLKESLEVSENDVEVISTVIKDTKLKEFSSQREKELAEILKNYAKYLREYAQSNLKIWQDIKSTQS
ncbi:hypothetical protein HG536_0A02520 [Torulaspora globosa]|uniref:Autophagy-related protein 20 n=1 Tax=Torulaspora globosa TaxID=48254 RepID=A0A7G3ZA99_9SACH|nr:uncharacterized protein HG536_0A02520 [Torulaspora globosa]QLL30435.1 hypothetical protein HG536_0A02520 [Torulaspora globosa]